MNSFKKKAMALLVIAMMVFVSIPAFAAGPNAVTLVWSGNSANPRSGNQPTNATGAQNFPWVISTPEQLAGLAILVNNGIDMTDVYFIITDYNSSIDGAAYPTDPTAARFYDNPVHIGAVIFDMAGIPWTPIGGVGPAVSGVPNAPYFAGVLDGNNNQLINLIINYSSTPANSSGYGLIGYMNGGTLANLKLGIRGDRSIISMGSNAATNVGAAVGYLNGNVLNVQNYINVTVANNNGSGVGGVVGTIEKAAASGAGPIQIAYTSNSGTILAGSRIGGIVGAVYDHYATGQTSSGVIVRESANMAGASVGTVQSGSRVYEGGVVGYNEGTISHTYNQGSFVSPGGNYVGGITGILTNYNPPPTGSLHFSYSSSVDADFPSLSVVPEQQALYASADNSTGPIIERAVYNVGYNHGQALAPNWGTQVGYVGLASVAQLAGVATILTPDAGNILIQDYFGGFNDPLNPGTNLNYFQYIGGGLPVVLWWQTAAFSGWLTRDYAGGSPTPPPTPTPDNPNAVFLDGTAATSGAGTPTDPVNNFADAVTALASRPATDRIIYILGTITVPSAQQATPATFSLSNAPAGSFVKRSSTFGGYLFSIQNGTATFDTITIDGNKGGVLTPSDSLIGITGGSVLIDTGTVLTSNWANSGAAIRISGGGNVNMRGGSITLNNAQGNGGGVAVYGASIFTMRGGSITANIANNYGGGVVIGDPSGVSSFTLNGGTISGNTAGNGASVALTDGHSQFFLTPTAATVVNGAIYLTINGVILAGDHLTNSSSLIVSTEAAPYQYLVLAQVTGSLATFNVADRNKVTYVDPSHPIILYNNNTQLVLGS